MYRLILMFIAFLMTACTGVHEQVSQRTTSTTTPYKQLDALTFYSTYISDNAQLACAAKNQGCLADPISAEIWFQITQRSLPQTHVSNGSPSFDYELLIASQQSDMPVSEFSDDGTASLILTEFTLQWRGFALDTYSTTTSLTQTLSKEAMASMMFSRWLTHAQSMGIFSIEFLYTAMRASNYRKDLSIPFQLGEFILEDTQLYADPFQGAISRYRHPMYENAILDISISPILLSLQKADYSWLQAQLEQDFEEAEILANQRQMPLTVDIPVSPINAGPKKGHFFAVHAVDEFDEPLYAATYLFKRKDKLVKFTSSFPHDVAHPLVIEALNELVVPDESELMSELRQLF